MDADQKKQYKEHIEYLSLGDMVHELVKETLKNTNDRWTKDSPFCTAEKYNWELMQTHIDKSGIIIEQINTKERNYIQINKK